MEKNKSGKTAGTLSSLPNIGPVLQRRLQEAGISTPEELRAAGSKEAFIRLRLRDPGACVSALVALEGAVQGVRGTQLPPETRQQLKDFFKTL